MNHGGLYSDDRRPKAFHQTLREFPNELSQSRSNGMWLSEATKRQLSSLHQSQKELTGRLIKSYKANSLNSSHSEKPRRLSPIKTER